MNYYQSKIVSANSFAELRNKIEDSLKTEGFGILTEIDIQQTMKKNLNKDYLPHVILGACNPVYADKVLSIEPNISTMLPCNVTIKQLADGKWEVATINPMAAMEAVGNNELLKHASEVKEKLTKVLSLI